MTLPIIIGIAAIFAVVGAIFLIKRVFSEEQNAVPISNPNEIKELTSAFQQPNPNESSGEGSQSKRRNKFTKLIKKKEADTPQGSGDPGEFTALREENMRLQRGMESYKKQFDRLEEGIGLIKKEYRLVKDSGLKEIQKLEEKYIKIQIEKAKSQPSHRLIEELKTKSELLERRLKEHQTRQNELKEAIGQIKAENNALMEKQSAETDRFEFEELSNRLAGSIAALETLKEENKDLQLSNQTLRNDFQKTEEHNQHLLKKEKVMHYELAKNRAQALGLEKICADLKMRIEAMATSAANDRQEHS